jgi:hypothetical protein
LGGYEVQMTPYAPEAANMVVNEAAELLRQVK